jgi:hypothetical protein
VLTGTIGFYACYWFVRTIYASVKIDWEGILWFTKGFYVQSLAAAGC